MIAKTSADQFRARDAQTEMEQPQLHVPVWSIVNAACYIAATTHTQNLSAITILRVARTILESSQFYDVEASPECPWLTSRMTSKLQHLLDDITHNGHNKALHSLLYQ
jgi:hypothetical protein